MCIELNTLKIENNKLYGTIKARNTVKVVFDGLHKEDLSLMFEYEFVNCDIFDKDTNTIIEESDHRIYVTKWVTRKIFIKAIVEIFAYAFAFCESR